MSGDGKGDVTKEELEDLMKRVAKRDPNQPEFLQAVHEVSTTLEPLLLKNREYFEAFERMIEPERAVQFRVAWQDDKGKTHVNRGFRVQFNQAIGPYKGGLRFHPSVNLSIVKFLGFEQILKNSLTGLPLGGGKGGSDFNPRGRSDSEVMRFCQAFMTELQRHIGASRDVPAGDIGVGGREIGYLFGQFKRLQSSFEGVLTGKHPNWGGSLMRPEATGYGVVYFAREMLKDAGDTLEGKTVCVSGSGNVAQYTVEKLLELGAKVLTMSDSSGFVYEKDGFTKEQLQQILDIKQKRRGRLSEYAEGSATAEYTEGSRPWGIKCDIAMPCATQNEVELEDAELLIQNGTKILVEAANMPTTAEATHKLEEAGVVIGPAKAANAGGVAVSGLEMAQNSARLAWSAEEVDERLQKIMVGIFKSCKDGAERVGNAGSLRAGANVAGFIKVADSMIAQGVL